MSNLLNFNEEKHEYTFKEKVVPGVSSLISIYYPFDPSVIPAAILMDAINIGKKMHSIVELYVKHGIFQKYDDFRFNEWLDAFKDIYDQLKEEGWKLYASEKILFYYDKENNIKYAGTADLILKKGNDYQLIDFKFTSAIYPRNKLQLYFYEKALVNQLNREGEKVDKIENFIFHFRKEAYSNKKGIFRLIIAELDENYDLWKGILAYLSIKQNHQKNIITKKIDREK